MHSNDEYHHDEYHQQLAKIYQRNDEIEAQIVSQFARLSFDCTWCTSIRLAQKFEDEMARLKATPSLTTS